VFVSSAAGLMTFTGYSAYSPTKYAVRGLAECLRNELRAAHVDVHVFYPSSLDTPGYAVEERTKPAACRAIEGTAALLSADAAAHLLDDGVQRGNFAITTEPLIELARMGANGIAPRNNTPLEMLVAPLLPIVQLGFVLFLDGTAASAAAADNRAKRS